MVLNSSLTLLKQDQEGRETEDRKKEEEEEKETANAKRGLKLKTGAVYCASLSLSPPGESSLTLVPMFRISPLGPFYLAERTDGARLLKVGAKRITSGDNRLESKSVPQNVHFPFPPPSLLPKLAKRLARELLNAPLRFFFFPDYGISPEIYDSRGMRVEIIIVERLSRGI